MKRFIFHLGPKPTWLLTLALGAFSGHIQAQQNQPKDSLAGQNLDEVVVSSLRAKTGSPVSFSNLSKAELAQRNLGQDIPILLNFMPSVVTTSDAGTGIGYTGLRVRGSDATRINVTINGVPYNDPESHGVYWVNLPDFASSVQSVQLQRGVGTSTNGAAAFGASLNLQTDTFQDKAMAEAAFSAGSFNTRKSTLKFSTGKLASGFELAGRMSEIKSDGYVDRAFAHLNSYFLQASYVGKSSLIKALVFGGKEHTYQSWYGIDPAQMALTRTYNYAGMYTDAQGNTQFYDNQTDNYFQNHYQLHWTEQWNSKWSSHLGAHYTKGKGFYEEYQPQDSYANYGLPDVQLPGGGTASTSDLVRQKWLDNDFYGLIGSLRYKDSQQEVTLGGGINRYQGDHFGRVIWSTYTGNQLPHTPYYLNKGDKTDGNTYVKYSRFLNAQWQLFVDMQLRWISYQADGLYHGTADDYFLFFNPKAGITYQMNGKTLWYASYARANREPNRTDYENGPVQPEMMDDYELGMRWTSKKVRVNLNGYMMYYRNQLILTGALDDVGNPIRANSDKSYRTGVELEAAWQCNKYFALGGNATWSQNRIVGLLPGGASSGNLTSQIAYSPSWIGAGSLRVTPVKNLSVTTLFKHVGMQFMNNIELDEARLPDYTLCDVNAQYSFALKGFVEQVTVTAMVNNVFDKWYISNGYMYALTPYYYPQAGRNAFVGINLRF